MTKGRVTIPTDTDMVEKTIELGERWGADAIRDCDGTDFPPELQGTDKKVYATYYTTRKDNEWALKNPEEIQQMYVMTPMYCSGQKMLSIPLMKGISSELLAPNTRDDIRRWWEVMDRTLGQAVPPEAWQYNETTGCVEVDSQPFHDYTVSFLAYIMWDPVHMYNTVVNDWKDVAHQITFDVRQPKTRRYTLERLKAFIESHPYVDVIRFTTFFHQFTLIFDELSREKYVDWYGYSASVSPYILDKFEREVGYRFRPEFIIDQGYYNNQYRIPGREYKDFQRFQRREVAALAAEMVNICHGYGKEAMMFLGDHWIGTEPFMEEFQTIGLDAVVGSVGNGATLRLISDIPGVKYTEGRLLPYFFPDTFHEGGDPVKEAKHHWLTARRAILRSPVDRIGYGGYLKLASSFPDFVDYVETVCHEFRELYENIRGGSPYCIKNVAVLNAWGRMRSWGNHMVHHALYHRENLAYFGVIEALSGAPFQVQFLSFDDIITQGQVPEGIDVIICTGGEDAQGGGEIWKEESVLIPIKKFVYEGGGFIGVGEPSGTDYQGRFIQLSHILGVEKERGLTLGYDKYQWEEHSHFITETVTGEIDFGEGARHMYALEGTEVLRVSEGEVKMAARSFGHGRGVYISGLPYSMTNARILHRAILWSASAEDQLKRWYSENENVDVHVYPDKRKYCVVNNKYVCQETTLYTGEGEPLPLSVKPGEILWYHM